MDDQYSSITATTLIKVNDLIIDKRTGEILGYDEKSSAFTDPIKYQKELGTCRSIDDLEDLLSFVDRRKLPPHRLHSLRGEADYAHGEWRRTGTDCRITIPQLRLLEIMRGLILYHNIIITTRIDLAKSLGTVESNLMKKLNVLIHSRMVRVFTSRNGSIRKGEIKLSVNPRLIFRGNDYARDRYIKTWYQPTGHLHTGAEAAQASDFLSTAA